MDKKTAAKEPVDLRKESDVKWEAARSQGLNKPLIINDLDFTELENSEDDIDPLRIAMTPSSSAGASPRPGALPPPPPLGNLPPPPPLLGIFYCYILYV